MKARITIRLTPNTKCEFNYLGKWVERRVDGPDGWEVVLLMQTSENQITRHTFHGYDKKAVLTKAYGSLAKARISLWIDQFMQEQLAKYANLVKAMRLSRSCCGAN